MTFRSLLYGRLWQHCVLSRNSRLMGLLLNRRRQIRIALQSAGRF